MPMGFTRAGSALRTCPAGLPGWTVLLLTAMLFLPVARAAAPPGYILDWREEFDQEPGSKPASTRWTYDLGAGGWGNAELQTYVNDAGRARIVRDPKATNGKALQIQAIKSASGVYTSARLKTQGRVSFQYGYIEARIRMPYGQGIWPAFWMLGTDITRVGWPACGEIDIMENIGREPGIAHGALHGPGYSGGEALGGAYTLPKDAAFKDSYHTFAILWREDAITFFVDGHAYKTLTPADLPPGAKWVYNKPFFIILNLAVGGQWPGNPNAGTVFPQNYRVDYVRVYKPKPPARKAATAPPGD